MALSISGIIGIVLGCEGIDFVDSQGSAKLDEVLELTNQAGIALQLARVKPAVGDDVLRRDDFLDHLGMSRTHGNVHRAVETLVEEAGAKDPKA